MMCVGRGKVDTLTVTVKHRKHLEQLLIENQEKKGLPPTVPHSTLAMRVQPTPSSRQEPGGLPHLPSLVLGLQTARTPKGYLGLYSDLRGREEGRGVLGSWWGRGSTFTFSPNDDQYLKNFIAKCIYYF